MGSTHDINVQVNGDWHRCQTEARTSLADFLRDQLGLTGTHLGCEHGVCGACTVLLNGKPIRSCIMLAAQVDGMAVTTIEGVGGPDGGLSPVQEAFCRHHATQCGFCTPGMVLAVQSLVDNVLDPTHADIDEAIGGNICRCTGYVQIREAIDEVLGELRQAGAGSETTVSPR